MTTTNATLAAQAREIAASAPSGSLTRRAAGCVAVALHTTTTLAAARKVLGGIDLADVRAAALELLGQLGTETETAR